MIVFLIGKSDIVYPFGSSVKVLFDFSSLLSGYLQVALTQGIPNYLLLEFPVFDGALRWQTLLAMKINWIRFLEITLMFTVDIDIFNLFDTKEFNEAASNKNIPGNRLART